MSAHLSAVASLLVIVSSFIIVFYAVVNGGYFLIHVLAILKLRAEVRMANWEPPFQPFSSPFYPGIAVIAPAYNEERNIVESVHSMLTLNYPDLEVVVVNDGSTDDTLPKLREHYDLERIEAEIPYDIPTEEIRTVYRSATHDELLVVDKENGGKSDALNAAIWLTDKPLFCAVDSDTIIDRDALLQIARPFLEEPTTAVASGGVIRVANGCRINDGIVEDVTLPDTGLPGLQVMEYLRAFYSGRLGLSRLNGLILISGAFGLFQTDVIREIGGYRHDTVTEDLDIVVRLHRYMSENDREYTVEFVPEPVAWTEVPDSRVTLGRQRRRWYRGMVDTVTDNPRMLFNPKYGRVGTVVLPFFVAAEMLGPLVEGAGYVLLPVGLLVGVVSPELVVTYFLLTSGFGVFLSWFGIFSEVWSFNRYDDPWQVLRLLWYGILENVGYRQWKTFVAWYGLAQYLSGVDRWGVMTRTGFGESDEET